MCDVILLKLHWNFIWRNAMYNNMPRYKHYLNSIDSYKLSSFIWFNISHTCLVVVVVHNQKHNSSSLSRNVPGKPPPPPLILDWISEPLIWSRSVYPIFGLPHPPPPPHKKEKLKKDKWLINIMQINFIFVSFIYLLSHTGTCKFLHTAKVIYWVLLGNMERGGGHDPELKAI